jgi:hypothetical protein
LHPFPWYILDNIFAPKEKNKPSKRNTSVFGSQQQVYPVDFIDAFALASPFSLFQLPMLRRFTITLFFFLQLSYFFTPRLRPSRFAYYTYPKYMHSIRPLRPHLCFFSAARAGWRLFLLVTQKKTRPVFSVSLISHFSIAPISSD